MRKKKCLVIIPGIPYPPIDGHKLKIFNLLKILKKKYDLHIVTIAEDNLTEFQLHFITTHSYKHKHFRITYLDNIKSFIKCIVDKKPFQVGLFSLQRVKRYLKENKLEVDFVFLNLIRSVDYLRVFENKPIVLDMVDMISKNYSNSIKNTTSILHKGIFAVEAKRLAAYEKSAVMNADLTLCVNEEEANILEKYGKVVWIPNGVNKELFIYKKTDGSYNKSIAFFGSMFYQPNIDAMIWFEKYVMDHLHPDIILYIIGARPSKSILRIGEVRKNIIVKGFLNDPYLILNSCFALIAPMQNGGGIQNKIIETMGMGKINIITPYAANPIIGGISGQHFIVEESPILMAKRINDIFRNPSNYSGIGKKAKELITEKYTWDSYSTQLHRTLKDII